MFNELISRFRKRKQIIDATEQLVNEVKENFSKQLEEIQEAHTLPYLDTRQVPGEHPWVDNPGEVNGEINTEVYQDEFELLWQMSQSMDSNVVYCENCKKPFAKVPKAKTKCKNCGEFIYKRSMMYDNKYTPVLVGEKGLKVYDRIHKGWTSYPPDRLRQIKKVE